MFRFSINFSGEFLTPTEQARLYQLLLTGLVAVAVTLIWGPQTLTCRRVGKEGDLLTRRTER